MFILDRLACAQNTNSEVPNQALARNLAEAQDTAGIAELTENRWNKAQIIAVIETRLDNDPPAQVARLKRVIKQAQKAGA